MRCSSGAASLWGTLAMAVAMGGEDPEHLLSDRDLIGKAFMLDPTSHNCILSTLNETWHQAGNCQVLGKFGIGCCYLVPIVTGSKISECWSD